MSVEKYTTLSRPRVIVSWRYFLFGDQCKCGNFGTMFHVPSLYVANHRACSQSLGFVINFMIHQVHYCRENCWVDQMDPTLISNYRMIMVSLIMTKLYNIIKEWNISSCAKHHRRQALGHASFRLKHSLVNHLVTLRVIMEESWLLRKTLCCYFLDFK